MLTSALDHYRTQQRITAAAVVEARRRRTRGTRAVAVAVTGFQLLAVRDSLASVDRMLAEQGIEADPVAEVHAPALIGTASDGRPLDTLFAQAETDYMFGLMVATQIQDVARLAAGVGIAARPNVGGYVRMLNPPSCSRCAVLAGRFYKWNAGFERHPRCDCRHIPSSESLAGDLTTDPRAYFDSLSEAEQARIFTKAGAQAIRDGADVGRVVNARRGMSTASRGKSGRRMLAPEEIGGRPVYLTRESTTVRGAAHRSRTGRNMKARLMPESIYEVAESRADALRLLKLHGYLI